MSTRKDNPSLLGLTSSTDNSDVNEKIDNVTKHIPQPDSTSSSTISYTKNAKKGRPKKISEKKYDKKVNTYLTNEDYEKLKMIADNNEETVAKFVRKIIKDYINGLN